MCLYLLTSLSHSTNNTLPRGQSYATSSVFTGHSFPRASVLQILTLWTAFLCVSMHIHSMPWPSKDHLLPTPRPPCILGTALALWVLALCPRHTHSELCCPV